MAHDPEQYRGERKGQIWVFFRMTSGRVVFWDESLDISRRVKGKRMTWSLDHQFYSEGDAIDAAQAARRENPGFPGTIEVAVAWGRSVWKEQGGRFPSFTEVFEAKRTEIAVVFDAHSAGGKEMSDLDKPLHIPTDKLITRLEEHLAEKEKVRADAEAEVAERRSKYTEAILAFDKDELTNIFDRFLSWDIDYLKKMKKEKTFVSEDSKPTPIEDRLAKQVRVLKMATDKEIEIFPSDSLYPLL